MLHARVVRPRGQASYGVGTKLLSVDEGSIKSIRDVQVVRKNDFIAVVAPHCGYCQNGMMIQAADLLATTKRPTEAQIRTAMNGHLCRCGTYPRILTAIQKAAAVMAKGGK